MLVCTVWLAIATAGALLLMRYERKPGAMAETPLQWPNPKGLALDARRDTLLLFAHPKCPCTRATLEELNRLLAHRPEKVAAHVLFLNPSTVSNSWTHTALRELAQGIRGVTVHDDQNGQTAAVFGAETSGFVVVYAPDGKLIFSGGITESRGHAGDNPNKDALVAQIDRAQPRGCKTPVFGCLLANRPSSEEAVQ